MWLPAYSVLLRYPDRWAFVFQLETLLTGLVAGYELVIRKDTSAAFGMAFSIPCLFADRVVFRVVAGSWHPLRESNLCTLNSRVLCNPLSAHFQQWYPAGTYWIT